MGCCGTAEKAGMGCCGAAAEAGDGIRPPSSEVAGVLAAEWGWRDYLGAVLVRLGFNRMSYGVAPGLYALGTPAADSLVLVTANYKLSVDMLRRELRGRDLWVLVLDTANVNVWCAAGKGTFGTGELVRRVEAVDLGSRTSRRDLILPQLGAPGVAAHEVAKRTGFKVVYGPARAADLPTFLDNGLAATPEMRRMVFPLVERLILTPIELRGFLPYALVLVAVMTLAAAWLSDGAESAAALLGGAGGLTLAAWLGGCLGGPLLLPYLPGRAFWVKGAFLGAALALAGNIFDISGGVPAALGGILFMAAAVSFTLMNFTGCATYTSQSGVKVELRAIPLQAAAGLLGIGLWLSKYWN